MYLYLSSYRRETARQLRMYAQLMHCFSAVAELLVDMAKSGLTRKTLAGEADQMCVQINR